MDTIRIDKWLWAARFFKTRTAATDAVVSGRVRVNGARAKPSKEVRPGDTVELRIGDVGWTVVVNAVADKRGPAGVAAALYDETPESFAGRDDAPACLVEVTGTGQVFRIGPAGAGGTVRVSGPPRTVMA